MQAIWSGNDAGMARTSSLQNQRKSISVKSFEDRVAVAKIAEQRVKGLLLWNGKPVYEVGLEYLLPEWLHNGLKFTDGYDLFLETFRHFPDLATDRALIQVKNAPHETGYSHVVMEAACYEASLRLHHYGLPVLVVWMFADRSLQAAWVGDLRVKPKEGSDRGSGTEMVLVSKDQLRPMRKYLPKL